MIENNFATACNDIDENLFEDSYMLFSSKDFTKFNLSKCEYVYVHRYGKLHMFFGKVGDGLLAPFSAPFSFCRMSTSNVKYSEYLGLLQNLKEKLKLSELRYAKFVLPPFFYDMSSVTKFSFALQDSGSRIQSRDINSHFDLLNFDEESLFSSAKKAIRSARKNMFVFSEALSLSEKKTVYDVIAENRASKGYPLRMCWDQVIRTAEGPAKARFFLVKKNDNPVASAIVFDVTKKVAQVIYWGATGDGERNKAMYYLPFELVKVYRDLGYEYLDIGPSSEDGVVSSGLNDYKQSIGCINSVKETWVLLND